MRGRRRWDLRVQGRIERERGKERGRGKRVGGGGERKGERRGGRIKEKERERERLGMRERGKTEKRAAAGFPDICTLYVYVCM